MRLKDEDGYHSRLRSSAIISLCWKTALANPEAPVVGCGEPGDRILGQYLAIMWKDGRPADTGCGKKGLWETQADLIRQGFPLNIGDGFLDIDCGVFALMVEPI